MSPATDERCPRCGGTLGTPASGSITQWIAICNCASFNAEKADDQEATRPRVCGKCGKRLKTGRSGSLTQWVFRQDLCACEVPEPVDMDEGNFNSLRDHADAEAQSSLFSAVFTGNRSARIEEVAMAVDAAKFPLDRYTPILEIGKGGSGTVYYCRDRMLDKIVAVKTLHALSAHQLLSFQNEARATSKLNHPAVIKVLDFGATAYGVPYMSMEYVDGVSIESLISQNKMFAVEEVVELFIDVCKGLSHAHSAGILHRDIKNSNLLIFDSNSTLPEVCIIDFGVAVLKKDDSEQGKTMVGTPRYMPPDQAKGETYDERSEVYELGCTLFEALTGDTPFLSEMPLDLMRQHAEEPPPRLCDRRGDVLFPEALEALVAKCLAKEKSQRYQTMNELTSALEELRTRGPQIEEEPQKGALESVAKAGSYILITVILVSGVVLSLNLGFGIFQNSQKLTEEKMPSVPDHAIYGAVLVDAASETLRPRFVEANRHGKPWTIAKGNVTNDSLVELAHRKDIQRLSLMGDQVDGRGLVFVLDLPLIAIDLNGTNVADKDIDVLRRFQKLYMLNIACTNFTNQGLARLNELSNLRDLGVGGPQIDDSSLEMVSRLDRLADLSIRESTRVTAGGIAKLSKIPTLSNITISNSKVDAPMLRALSELKQLSELHIYEVRFVDDAFASLKDARVKIMKLRRDRLTDSHLEQIGAMKGLRALQLQGSYGFSEQGLARLQKRLPNCEIEL